MSTDRSSIEAQLEAYVLDLLDADERRDVERALATDPDLAAQARHLRTVLADLAYDERRTPPSHLRDQVLDDAETQRSAGRHIGDTVALEPVATRAAMVESMLELLDGLSNDDLSQSTVYGSSVEDLVRHLVAAEASLLDAFRAPEAAHAVWQSDWAQTHLALHDSTVIAPVAAFRETAETVSQVLSDRPESGGPAARALVTRAFELWTHADDIRRAIGQPLEAPAPAVLRSMAELAVELSVPLAGGANDARTVVRFTLTGAGGGSWVYAVDGSAGNLADTADAHLIADVVDYCRLAAARHDPASVLLDAQGDIALIDRLLQRVPELADFGAGSP